MVATWSHTFDFTQNDGGFRVDPHLGAGGSYIPDIGWIATPAVYRKAVTLNTPQLGDMTITNIVVMFENVDSSYDPASNGFIQLRSGGPNGTIIVESQNVSLTTGETSRALLPLYSGSVPATGDVLRIIYQVGVSATVTNVTIAGVGANPFLQNEGLGDCSVGHISIDAEEVVIL